MDWKPSDTSPLEGMNDEKPEWFKGSYEDWKWYCYWLDSMPFPETY